MNVACMSVHNSYIYLLGATSHWCDGLDKAAASVLQLMLGFLFGMLSDPKDGAALAISVRCLRSHCFDTHHCVRAWLSSQQRWHFRCPCS